MIIIIPYLQPFKVLSPLLNDYTLSFREILDCRCWATKSDTMKLHGNVLAHLDLRILLPVVIFLVSGTSRIIRRLRWVCNIFHLAVKKSITVLTQLDLCGVTLSWISTAPMFRSATADLNFVLKTLHHEYLPFTDSNGNKIRR